MAFGGETITDVMAAVITREPDWTALPKGSPTRLLRRCLEKDPKRRLRDIGDAFAEAEAPASTAPFHVSLWRQPLVAALLLMAIISSSIALYLWTRSSSPLKAVSCLVIPLPPGQELTSYPAISPDGQLVAYTATHGTEEPRLYLRDLNSYDARPVSGSQGASQPFFSPDSQWVAFFARGQLFKAAVAGEPPIKLPAAACATLLGGTWNIDDTIIFTPGMGSGLLQVPAAGGPTEILTKPEGGADGHAHAWPQALPGGRSVLFTVWGKGTYGNAVLSLETRRWQLVLPGHGGAVFGSPGFLFVGDDEGTGLKVAAFDPVRPAPTTAQNFVLIDVYGFEDLERPWLSVSKTGTAAYAMGNPGKRSLVWVDLEGGMQSVSEQQTQFSGVTIAPDGSRAAIKQGYDLWVYDFQRGTQIRLTFHGNTQESSSSQVWSRDGKRVIFASNGGGNWDIYSQPADGSRPAELLLRRQFDQFPASMAPDGSLVFAEAHPTTGEDLWILSPDGKASPWRVTQFNESNAVFSPDGHWLAYDSDESGRYEIYVQAYPSGEKRLVVSTRGGYLPRWSGDGKGLFYFAGDAVMSAVVRPGGPTAPPRRLFDRSPFLVGYNTYDVSRDGKHLLMIRRDPGSVPRQINVIQNWSEELNRLIPAWKK